MKPIYCIYFHINPLTNKIFYVGKGLRQRPKNRSPRSTEWKRTVSESKGFIIDVIETGLNHFEALDREKFWINKIGRQCKSTGSLINILR